MKLPQYITVGEVKKVCRELGLRDWTKIKKLKVTAKEAGIILKIVNVKKCPSFLRPFAWGWKLSLNMELCSMTRM